MMGIFLKSHVQFEREWQARRKYILSVCAKKNIFGKRNGNFSCLQFTKHQQCLHDLQV